MCMQLHSLKNWNCKMPITFGFFQSGFRCRDHSTSSERMQSLQKRHEKPLAPSQASRAEQSPEPLYFEVLLCENTFRIVAMPVVYEVRDVLNRKLQNIWLQEVYSQDH